MDWLAKVAKEHLIIPPSSMFVYPVKRCFHCDEPIRWDENNKRASEYGSFVGEDGTFSCPTGLLHQG